MIKDYLKLTKVKQDFFLKQFYYQSKCDHVGPTLISLNYKVKTNVFLNFLDPRATHSFMRMGVIERLRWATTKVVKPINVQLAQGEMKPTHKGMFTCTKNVMGPSSRQTSRCVS
jgi:hypothetical protein